MNVAWVVGLRSAEGEGLVDVRRHFTKRHPAHSLVTQLGGAPFFAKVGVSGHKATTAFTMGAVMLRT